jgi:hypothetical protein
MLRWLTAALKATALKDFVVDTYDVMSEADANFVQRAAYTCQINNEEEAAAILYFENL